PLTGDENRFRLLAIASQDARAEFRTLQERQLNEVFLGMSHGVCAFAGTTPVGYAVYRQTLQTYHIDTIAIDRFHRRAGVGSALLDWICADVKRRGGTVLNIVTDASAKEMVNFCLHRGFILAGSVRDEFLPGVTQVHLTREIR